MNAELIIRAAIPNADDAIISHIVWGRTPYPFAPVSARDLYRAASAYRRAKDHGNVLCDFCPRLEQPGRFLCASCENALTKHEPHDGYEEVEP